MQKVSIKDFVVFRKNPIVGHNMFCKKCNSLVKSYLTNYKCTEECRSGIYSEILRHQCTNPKCNLNKLICNSCYLDHSHIEQSEVAQ